MKNNEMLYLLGQLFLSSNEFIYYKYLALDMEYLYAWSIILIIFVLSSEILISYISKKKDLVL